ITFTTESVADKVFSAKLARKSGRIDQETRTELWEYEFNNNTADLMPGMYAVAQLNLNRPSRSFVVPYSTVVTSLEKKFVIRISDNRAEWAEVREGIPLENGIEIFGDLNEGDVLLTTGSEEIKPGTAIHVNLQ
ncbi:MAG: efflux RND transporter periplasmic adaptor subunit, partial [Cyclobacteriaceae bacterium]|nr:efflux RND transporter periplasmic adaptor subunit [Cyclobacteriaceae bacterium]